METQQKRRRRQFSLSHLPTELISEILKCLKEFEDILAFALVCRAWKYQVETLYPQFKSLVPFLANIGKGKLPVLSPLVLVSNIDSIEISRSQGGGFSSKYPDQDSCTLFNTQTHQSLKILLPELQGRWFSSSPFGWLLTIPWDETENLSLLNPFTTSQIELPSPPPPLTFPHRQQYLRVITSTSPLDPNCVALASHLFSSELAFFRPAAADKTWTMIHDESEEFVGHCNDTICYKGDFYATDYYGDIYHVDLGRSILVKLPVRRVKGRSFCLYLVELNGDLLLVSRISTRETSTPNTSNIPKFLVYKLAWKKKEWVQKKNIGNNAIFLGKHGSASLAITEGIPHFEANCIYFVDDIVDAIGSNTPAIGVYNMKTRHSEWLYQDSPIWTGSLNWLGINRRLNPDA